MNPDDNDDGEDDTCMSMRKFHLPAAIFVRGTCLLPAQKFFRQNTQSQVFVFEGIFSIILFKPRRTKRMFSHTRAPWPRPYRSSILQAGKGPEWHCSAQRLCQVPVPVKVPSSSTNTDSCDHIQKWFGALLHLMLRNRTSQPSKYCELSNAVTTVWMIKLSKRDVVHCQSVKRSCFIPDRPPPPPINAASQCCCESGHP